MFRGSTQTCGRIARDIRGRLGHPWRRPGGGNFAARSERIYRGSLVVGYAAIHFAYAAARIRFRADPLDRFAQFLEPPLLEERLLEACGTCTPSRRS